jgi:DNA polymerase III gamma/tau subunit
VLSDLDRSLSEGCQLGSLTEQLLTFLRDLMISAAGAGAVNLMSVSDSSRERVQNLANQLGLRRVGASLQILADCRARMQRTTYGRPLLELALVRMTLLGELSEIGALLEGGAATAAASAPARMAAPPARPVLAPAAAADLKKNALSEPPPVVRVEAAVSEPERVSRTQDAPKRGVEELLGPESWEEVLLQLPEQLASHVRKSNERAILGPKALAVLFGSNYFLSKSYCERPDAVNRLAAAASEVCGEAVGIQIRASAPKATTSSTSPNPRNTSNRRSTSSTQNDPFVQQAIAVFGGSVAEVRETLGTVPGTTEPGG